MRRNRGFRTRRTRRRRTRRWWPFRFGSLIGWATTPVGAARRRVGALHWPARPAVFLLVVTV